MHFIQTSRKYIKENKFDNIFIVYFQAAFLLGLLFRSENTIMDIRTGAVWYDPKKRKIDDRILKFESLFFKHVTVISECLSKRLKINEKKVHILPLGSDSFVTSEKSYDTLKLLYVGGFNNRNIADTIYGLKIFMDDININIDIQYDIVGYGHDFEESKIVEAIDNTNLSEYITFHGKISYAKLKPFFEKSNVGVCYVPVTDYFNCQPSTKLFEYVNSGLVCIATNTDENRAYIDNKNGILCMDNSDSFAKALAKLHNNREKYNTEEIINTLEKFSWKKIISDNLSIYLNKVNNDKA
jgi:glycosyltransferase involved in cell wall biosynthesis